MEVQPLMKHMVTASLNHGFWRIQKMDSLDTVMIKLVVRSQCNQGSETDSV